MARTASPPLPRHQSDFDVHMNQAQAFSVAGQVAQAIGLYRTAALAAEGRQEFRNALRAYAEIVRLEGPQSDTILKLGEMQHRTGRSREAAATLDRAAHQALLAGRVEIGLHAYRLAAEAEPTAARWKHLIDWCTNIGRDQDAYRHLEEGSALLFRRELYDVFIVLGMRLLELNPEHMPTLRMMMRAQLQRKNLHRVVLTVAAVLQQRPGDADAIEHMAETFAALGRVDKAAEVLARLATALLDEGSAARAEAKRMVARGLQWNPSNEVLQDLQRSFVPPPPKVRKTPPPPPRNDAPALDLSDFVEVEPGPSEYENDFEEVQYTQVRDFDILEVAELTRVIQRMDLIEFEG